MDKTEFAIEHLRMALLSARSMNATMLTVPTEELSLALTEIDRLAAGQQATEPK